MLIIGVLLAGLDGAINGFAVGMLIAAAVWLALHAVVVRGASAARAVSTVASSAVPTCNPQRSAVRDRGMPPAV
ncbi:hypothetical protein GCM10022230_13530 [Pseudoclavibacter caeni]